MNFPGRDLFYQINNATKNHWNCVILDTITLEWLKLKTSCFFHLCWLSLSLNKMFVQLCKCLSDSMMLKAWESKHFESWIASNPTRHWKLTWHLSVDYTLSSLSVWPSVRSLHSFNSFKMTESIANKLSTKQFRRRTFQFIHLKS